MSNLQIIVQLYLRRTLVLFQLWAAVAYSFMKGLIGENSAHNKRQEKLPNGMPMNVMRRNDAAHGTNAR